MDQHVTVAVVDGNPGTLRGLIHCLQQMPGIVVVGEAGSPSEALTVVRERRPEVVVLDIRRLAPNAAEFLGQLTAAAPQAGIVVLTAYCTERERADLTQAGARAILWKEIDSGALVCTIRTVAGRGGPQAPVPDSDLGAASHTRQPQAPDGDERTQQEQPNKEAEVP